MLDRNHVIKEIKRVENITLNVKQELKTLKNRVRAYKVWTKRYRKQKEELKQEAAILKHANLVVCQQRDEVTEDLKIKQHKLLEAVEKASKSKAERDLALSQLDEVITKIEQYKEVCERASKINYADKTYLIREAEKLFFDEELLNQDLNLDSKESPQMFTDPASIGRSLLDR